MATRLEMIQKRADKHLTAALEDRIGPDVGRQWARADFEDLSSLQGDDRARALETMVENMGNGTYRTHLVPLCSAAQIVELLSAQRRIGEVGAEKEARKSRDATVMAEAGHLDSVPVTSEKMAASAKRKLSSVGMKP